MSDPEKPTDAANPPHMSARAVKLHVRGVVQGVGFRPFVQRLALANALSGWVRNESDGVHILVEGSTDGLDRFREALTREAPPLAQLSSVSSTPTQGTDRATFRILASEIDPKRRLPVSPDTAICAACEHELMSPENRRFRYPFITCTDCGPRFTIIEAMPYDRIRTTMASFEQCAACRGEYERPGDRRCHSQTNSCGRCGPRLWFVDGGENSGGEVPALRDDDGALALAVAALRRGEIVALRGLGGFHLAVDATAAGSVRRLRKRKAREAKPFAVMVMNLDHAKRIGRVHPGAARRLTSAERPIVLVDRSSSSPVAGVVAPRLTKIGVMLPSTPLHRLILEDVGRPLVMTSGNSRGEPIVVGNEEALRSLSGIADGFLLHDREIVQRSDDSVEQVTAANSLLYRRSRGFAPLPIPLPMAAPVPLVATGPQLKNTLTLGVESVAYVSQHIGDLDTLAAMDHFKTALAGLQSVLSIQPELAVHDLHPGYLSTRLAQETGLACLAVQHHHAHIAAVLGEHGSQGPAIGVAYDGTGYGLDGTVWGGEILLADLVGFERLGHIRTAPLPGGDLAVQEPWRAALGFASLAEDSMGPLLEAARSATTKPIWRAVNDQIRANVNTPPASSVGRLFDAAAAALRVRHVNLFEGQAAMELEALAGDRSAPELPFPWSHSDTGWIMNPLPLLDALARGAAADEDVADLSAAFHDALIRTTVDVTTQAASDSHVDLIVLAGGCFQNRRLLEGARTGLLEQGLRVLTAGRLPANDGAISYGQAVVAAAGMAVR